MTFSTYRKSATLLERIILPKKRLPLHSIQAIINIQTNRLLFKHTSYPISLNKEMTTCQGQDRVVAFVPPIVRPITACCLTLPTSPAWPHWL